MNLRQIGEFGLIRRIQKQFHPPLFSVPLGIGDDAAAILPTPGKYLLLTTDSLLEQVHFDLSFTDFSELGRKALAVNLSDIAAMGGRPRFFLVSLGVSDRQTVQEIDRLYRGMRKASREAGTELIGGNTTYTRGPLFISITLLGEVSKKEMTTRAGAKRGDHLYVTGTLGDAAAGLALLKKGGETGRFAGLVRRYHLPEARWREGALLAENAIPSAMIDLSDGLSSDLRHLSEQSRVGAELDLGSIPISPPLKRYARRTGADPLEYALNGGEDYELLFAVPDKKVKRLEALIGRGAIAARRIGKIVEAAKGLTARGLDGRLRPIEPKGYDHFRA